VGLRSPLLLKVVELATCRRESEEEKGGMLHPLSVDQLPLVNGNQHRVGLGGGVWLPQEAGRPKSLYKHCLCIWCERDDGQNTLPGLWEMAVAGTVQ